MYDAYRSRAAQGNANDNRDRHQYPCVVWLCIRPNGKDQLPMEEHWPKKTPTGTVEDWSDKNGKGDVANKEREEVPTGKNCSGQEERRKVPDAPAASLGFRITG